ncbi:polysaccharide deacetylase family protein [Bosea sp. (in: a-proteobacteria)]|uniref:polysaccharide deacetylase family protein n=1 Tax=Bosea sp. (in: a-proteobacteria) TaxID=1871050 RepID=UPI003B3A3C0D
MLRQPWYDDSAIVARPRSAWPGGRRLAVYVALGVEEYSFGEGLTEDLLPGAPKPDLVNTAWRDYGNRVGGFRLIDRLGGMGIRPTLLLNTGVYQTAPAMTDHARKAGAEIVAHGIVNSDTLATLGCDDELAYLNRVRADIIAHEGCAPGGWSSPWLAHSPTTLANLRRAGFGYLLDLRMDDQPVWLRTEAGPLLSIPYAAEINDSSTIIGRNASAADFADMIVDEFEELLAASRDQALVMSIVVHSFISGQPFRLRSLTRALQHLVSRSEDVWFCTPGEIAAASLADPSLVA